MAPTAPPGAAAAPCSSHSLRSSGAPAWSTPAVTHDTGCHVQHGARYKAREKTISAAGGKALLFGEAHSSARVQVFTPAQGKRARNPSGIRNTL
eukprot:7280695-Pyramimonas_sp.AAC.2